MQINNLVNGIADKSKHLQCESDYLGSDGLLYCPVCNEVKQCEVSLNGEKRLVSCMCKCQREEYVRTKAEKDKITRQLDFKKLTSYGLAMPLKGRFENAEENAIIATTKKYAEKWEEIKHTGGGWLFWGNTGTGKTFTASCICNEIIKKGETVLMTSFPEILTALQGLKNNERLDIISEFKKYDLLVIDDLGAERDSQYAQEVVYAVINARYNSKKPLILTTNLTLNEIKNPQNMQCKRIYSRITEMCIPMQFEGDDRRKKDGQSKTEQMRELLK